MPLSLNERDRRRRAAMMRRSSADLLRVFTNSDGFDRLRRISPEVWAETLAAEREFDGGGGNAT